MMHFRHWGARSVVTVMAAFVLSVASCSKTPVAPTPPPPVVTPPPVPNAPSVSCVEGISRSTVSATGMAVTFDTPTATDGQGTVNVACSPASGQNFPIGSTQVTCTATDALSRTGSCTFSVTVSRLATLQSTKFLAFGDSITAGEVSPATATVQSLLKGITKNVVVPSLSWPTVLQQTLRGRYATQTFTVANFGVSGERVVTARSRFLSALTTERPEVVLLLHGHNDIAAGADGAASGAAAELEQMVAEARQRGMRVYLATVLPARTGGTTKPIPQLYIDDFNARLRIIAARQAIPIVDTYAALRTDVTRYIGIDGLHPSEAGYAKIADTFFQAIQTSLEVR